MFYILSKGVLTKQERKRVIDCAIQKGDILHTGTGTDARTHVCIDARASPFDSDRAYPTWRPATPEEEALIKTHILIEGHSI